MTGWHGGHPARKPNVRSKANRKIAETVLHLPDLEFAKTAVLNSLTSPDAQRGYRHAIDEFVDCYYSEPRLAFNKLRREFPWGFRPGMKGGNCISTLLRFGRR